MGNDGTDSQVTNKLSTVVGVSGSDRALIRLCCDIARRGHLPPERPRRQDGEDGERGSERRRHEDQEHRRAQDTVKRQSAHGAQGGGGAESRPKTEKRDWIVLTKEPEQGAGAAGCPDTEEGLFLSQSVCAWLSVHPTLMISMPPAQVSATGAERKNFAKKDGAVAMVMRRTVPIPFCGSRVQHQVTRSAAACPATRAAGELPLTPPFTEPIELIDGVEDSALGCTELTETAEGSESSRRELACAELA